MTINKKLNLRNSDAEKRNPLFYWVRYSKPLLLVLWSERSGSAERLL
jgi:hypothetical protein